MNLSLDKLSKTELIAEIRMLQKLQQPETQLEQRTREEKLSDNNLDLIINNISIPIFIKDNESKLLLVNDAFCNLFNLEKDKMVGKTLAEEVPPKEQQTFLRIDKQVLATGKEIINEETLSVTGKLAKIISTRKSRFIDANGNKFLVGIIHDITEQKEIEEGLKQTTQLLNASQSIAKLGGWELDLETGNLYWTDETFRIHDTSPEEFNPTVDAGVGYFLPESRAVISNALEAAINEGTGYDLELQTNTTKGRLITVRTTCEVKLKNGKPSKLIGIFQDITEQKEAEQAMFLSNNKYKSLFNDSPIPLWEEDFTDLESYLNDLQRQGHKDLHSYLEKNPNELVKCAEMIKVIDVNQAALDLHGAKRKNHLIENLHEIFSKSSYPIFIGELLALVAKKETYQGESEVKTLQGELKHIYVTLKFDRSQPGKVRAILATTDITKRKQADKKLLESMDRFRSIVDQSPLSTQMFTPDGETVQINSAYQNLWEITLEDLKDYNILEDQQLVSLGIMSFIQRAFSGESITLPIAEYDTVKSLGKGKKSWIKARIYPVKDITGNISNIILMHEDITDTKIAEALIKESESELATIVNNTEDSIWSLDKDYNYITFNKAYANMFLATYGFEVKKGMNAKDQLLPEELAFWTTLFDAALKGEKQEFEFSHDFNDVKHYFKTSLNPIYEDNIVTGVSALSVDKTNETKIEQKLIESNTRYKSLFNDSPIPLWEEDFTDLESYLNNLKQKGNKDLREYFENNSNELVKCAGLIRVIDVNQAALNLHNAKSKEQLIKNLSKTFSENSLSIFQEELLVLIEGKETYESEAEVKTLQGEVKHIYVTLKFDRSQPGKVRAILATTDITKRKLADQELEDSLVRERLLANIVRESVVGIAIGYPDGRLGMCNAAFQNITGYNEEELRTIDWNTVLTPPEWEELESAKLDELQRTKKTVKYEKEYIKKDGSRIPIELIVNPQFDNKGEVEYYFAFVIDITERVKEKEEKEKLFNDLGERMKELSCLYSISKAIDKLGITLEHVFEETVSLLPPSWKYPENTCARIIFENKEYKTENFKETKWKQSANLIIQGKIIGTVTVCYLEEKLEFDESPFLKEERRLIQGVAEHLQKYIERKQTEEALRESEERFELAMKAAKDGLYDWDLVTNDIYYSPGWKKMLGYEDVELPNEFSVWENLINPKDAERSWEMQKELINQERNRFELEFKMKHKDGNYIDILSRAEIVFDENGKATRMIGTHVDVSERKLMENELISSKEKAEESDRLKSAFLANMSHEIRTPMNGILGFAELLKKPNLSGADQQRFIGIIQKSGDRMLNIINDIVSISKIESGLMRVNLQDSNINEQIEFIYNFFKPEVEKKGVQFSFNNSLSAIDSNIKTDREKVYAILTNLVKNAIKFTHEGSLEFGYITKNDTLEFYVRDTGIGIPKDRQKAIFERFIQADIEDAGAFQGAGLGLSISVAYVKMLDGNIWVESEEGKGSCFYFTLPFTDKTLNENRVNTETLMDDESLKVRNLKILIAEDDEASEQLLSIYVAKLSDDISSVGTGTEAVSKCLKNPDIDIILMDVLMPEMDGLEATRKIREFNKDVIIIAQTAFGLEGDREKAIAAGCNDYIAKPILENELKQMIFNNLKTTITNKV